MSRLAVIDIGTNSVKMTVADASAGTLVIRSEQAKTTRLGEGVDVTKRLSDAAMDRTFSAINEFVTNARGSDVSQIAATGTSALRDSTNGSVFLSRVRKELGIDIEIIAGDREAQLAYRAVASDSVFGFGVDKQLVIFDIGGGSTELICGIGAAMTAFRSLDIGAVRLTERHLHFDPPTREEYASARADARTQIATFTECSDGIITLGGVGGTAVNVAAAVYGVKDVHGKTVRQEELRTTVERFLSMPLNDRKKIPGLEPERADIILGGTAILEEILNRFQAESFCVSVRGMRYGLLAELALE